MERIVGKHPHNTLVEQRQLSNRSLEDEGSNQMGIPFTESHIQRLVNVFIEAFTFDDIRQMVRIGLENELEVICLPQGSNLRIVVDRLIRYCAEKKGGVHHLLSVAVNFRSTNQALSMISAEYMMLDFEPLHIAGPLESYYRFLINSHDSIPMGLFAPNAIGANENENANELDLTQIYIAVDTTANIETDESRSRPVSVLEAAGNSKKLALLGKPGAGKSTFLDFLILCLAQHNLAPNDELWLSKLPGWPSNLALLTPIPIRLRDFAYRTRPEQPNEPQHLWRFIVDWLKRHNVNGNHLSSIEEMLHNRLEAGEALLLLDGLDEVPKDAMDSWVRSAIATFLERYDECRVVVTCRTFAFQDPHWQMEGFKQYTIAEFDDNKINSFIAAWYNELYRSGQKTLEDSHRLADCLREAVRRRDVSELAQNPLLLTVIAQIHTYRGQLPDQRVQLYKDGVDLLLTRWEAVKGLKPLSEMLATQGRNVLDLEKVLWRVAYNIHEENGKDVPQDLADIPLATLVTEIAKLHRYRDEPWAMEMLGLVRNRSGLLFERTSGIYAFAHRTFQEYLAGCQLASESSGDIAKKMRAMAKDETIWREPILLAAARLAHVLGDLPTPCMMIDELCPNAPPKTNEEWRRVWLAAQVLEEIGSNRTSDTEYGERLVHRVSTRLAALVKRNLLKPVERVAAGRTLGRIGDRRPGVGVTVDFAAVQPRPKPDIYWCSVSAGPFQMGGDRLVARGYWEGETYDIPYTYHIAKYPITYAQYEPFVEDGGYQQEKYWTEAGWYWRITPNSQTDRRHIVDHPKYWMNPRWHVANHPVIGLSWYECMAYTQWLTEQLGYVVRLPTEAEWEKAARYPDSRCFPWGNEPKSGYANVNEPYEHIRWDTRGIDTNVRIGEHYIGRTSAVGIYAAHASALGLCDLSGNVWEWLLSPQTSHVNAIYNHFWPEEVDVEGNIRRQMRGGSWLTDIARARLAYRASNPPMSQDTTDGFRLVRDDRFTPNEWRRIQQTASKQRASNPDEKPAERQREYGIVLEYDNESGRILLHNGAILTFSSQDVTGASAFRLLHKGDNVALVTHDTDCSGEVHISRVCTGRVRRWNGEAAFGSIDFREESESNMDIYMHQNDIMRIEDWESMRVNDLVEFEVEDAFLYGEWVPEARNIRIIQDSFLQHLLH
jgi:formylglycine-generating enzyme required for sulfatase activity